MEATQTVLLSFNSKRAIKQVIHQHNKRDNIIDLGN